MSELKKVLANLLESKEAESCMINAVNLNVKVPQEHHGELTEILEVNTVDEEILEKLYELEPEELVDLLTLALMANGRVENFVRAERNAIALKLSTVNYLKNHPEYRKTAVDNNGDNPDKMLSALIQIQKVLKHAGDNE